MATSPDAEDDQRTAERLHRGERFSKDKRRDNDGQKRDEKLETRHARRANHGDSGEVENVREATRTEGGIEDAKQCNGWDCWRTEFRPLNRAEGNQHGPTDHHAPPP